MDYSLITQKDIENREGKLPDSVKKILESKSDVDFVSQICQTLQVHDEEAVLIVEQLTGLILLGFVDLDKFAEEIEKNTGLNYQTSSSIASAIENKIFLPIKGEIRKNFQPIDDNSAAILPKKLDKKSLIPTINAVPKEDVLNRPRITDEKKPVYSLRPDLVINENNGNAPATIDVIPKKSAPNVSREIDINALKDPQVILNPNFTNNHVKNIVKGSAEKTAAIIETVNTALDAAAKADLDNARDRIKSISDEVDYVSRSVHDASARSAQIATLNNESNDRRNYLSGLSGQIREANRIREFLKKNGILTDAPQLDLLKKITALPENVKDWIFSPDVFGLIDKINDRLQVKSRDSWIVMNAMEKFLIKDVTPEEFSKELAEGLNFDEIRIFAAVEEIKQNIFGPIKPALQGLGVNIDLIKSEEAKIFGQPASAIKIPVTKIEPQIPLKETLLAPTGGVEASVSKPAWGATRAQLHEVPDYLKTHNDLMTRKSSEPIAETKTVPPSSVFSVKPVSLPTEAESEMISEEAPLILHETEVKLEPVRGVSDFRPTVPRVSAPRVTAKTYQARVEMGESGLLEKITPKRVRPQREPIKIIGSVFETDAALKSGSAMPILKTKEMLKEELKAPPQPRPEIKTEAGPKKEGVLPRAPVKTIPATPQTETPSGAATPKISEIKMPPAPPASPVKPGTKISNIPLTKTDIAKSPPLEIKTSATIPLSKIEVSAAPKIEFPKPTPTEIKAPAPASTSAAAKPLEPAAGSVPQTQTKPTLNVPPPVPEKPSSIPAIPINTPINTPKKDVTVEGNMVDLRE